LASLTDAAELLDWAHDSGAGLVEDGSIPDAGCEINTNPASGDVYLSEMRALTKALKNSGAVCDNSCGLHVHADASDYSQYDLRRLAMLWSLVERAMFDLAGKRRIESKYCQPSSSTYIKILASNTEKAKDWRRVLAAVLYDLESENGKLGREVRSNKRDRYHGARYYALNLHSFFFRKTIEFRLHEGSTDSATLENWPLVCGHIVTTALRMREADIIALARSKETSADILCSFLPPSLSQWVQDKIADRHKARRAAGTEDYVNASLYTLDNGRRSLVSHAERMEFISSLRGDAGNVTEYESFRYREAV